MVGNHPLLTIHFIGICIIIYYSIKIKECLGQSSPYTYMACLHGCLNGKWVRPLSFHPDKPPFPSAYWLVHCALFTISEPGISNLLEVGQYLKEHLLLPHLTIGDFQVWIPHSLRGEMELRLTVGGLVTSVKDQILIYTLESRGTIVHNFLAQGNYACAHLEPTTLRSQIL